LSKKYIKWGVWRVAVCPSYIKDARFLKVKYLGSVMTSCTDIDSEIKSKLAAGNKCYYALRPILKRSVSQSIKIRLYKTIIRQVVIYGAERNLREICTENNVGTTA
jgi:hypothetical protein